MIDTKIYGQNTKQNISKHLMMEFRNITVWSCHSISFDRIVMMLPRISEFHIIKQYIGKKHGLNFTNQFPRKKLLKKIFTKFLSTIHFSGAGRDLSRGSSLNWLRYPALETPQPQIAGRVWWFVSWKMLKRTFQWSNNNLSYLGIEQMDFV